MKNTFGFFIMATAACYNCGDTSHVSKRCPQRQEYTRCPECFNVCLQPGKHRQQCQNDAFISTRIDDVPMVFEVVPILQLEFEQVSDVFISSGNQDKKVGDLPLWVPGHALQLKFVDGILNFDGAKEKSYTIGINDSADRRRLRLYISNVMVINGRYTILDKGIIKYDPSVDDNPFGHTHLTIKVNSASPLIKIRAKLNGKYFYIDSYSGGAILKDPLERNLRNRMEFGK